MQRKVLVLITLASLSAIQTVLCDDIKVKVVGGISSAIEHYPFIAQLLVDAWSQGKYEQICAGTILTARHVLTVAHCFQYNKDTARDYNDPKSWNVRVGSSFRSYGGALYAVQKIVKHPLFNAAMYNYDQAVVVIPRAIDLGPTVAQSTIAQQDTTIPTNADVVLLGWGATTTRGPPSDQLQVVSIKTVDQEICRHRYANLSAPITDNMLCAGILDIGGADGCHGDSGGPLLYNGVVVGLVSFGYACGHSYYPGVYSKVSFFTNWIVTTVNEN